MAESFADLRTASRVVQQDKPEVIERKRGGAVPPQAKLVGPVIRGKAAEREMQRMEKQAAAAKSSNAQKGDANGGGAVKMDDDADDKPVKKRLDRPIKRATGGGVRPYVPYLFPTAGGPTTASSTPGGRGLIPTINVGRASLTRGSSPTPPSNNSNSGNAVDKAKQIQTTIGDASKWVTPSNSATPAAATSAVDDPNGIGGLYARGGVVAKNYRGGAAPARNKLVGPVIKGKAAEREMRAMEDEVQKGSTRKEGRPARRLATGGAASWLPEGAGTSGFPSVPNSPPTPIAPASTPLPANQGRNANAAASQILNATGAAGLRATAALNQMKPPLPRLKTS